MGSIICPAKRRIPRLYVGSLTDTSRLQECHCGRRLLQVPLHFIRHLSTHEVDCGHLGRDFPRGKLHSFHRIAPLDQSQFTHRSFLRICDASKDSHSSLVPSLASLP